MIVKFIAHAGIALIEDDTTLLVDPWFTDSSLSSPLLEGLNGWKTIDFHLPETQEKIENYAPSAILLSHLHTHHAPLKDILSLIENSLSDIIVALPEDKDIENVRQNLSPFRNALIKTPRDGEIFTCGPFSITALSHTVKDHLAWSIRSTKGHVLHIADSRIHSNTDFILLDPVWEKYFSLQPDLVFMSAGRNSVRVENNSERTIIETGAFSPIQAAKLIQKLQPKVACSIGNQNHSYLRNRLEYIPETSNSEEEFRWAVSWLSPKTKCLRIRPGHTFSLGEAFDPNQKADTYL